MSELPEIPVTCFTATARGRKMARLVERHQRQRYQASIAAFRPRWVLGFDISADYTTIVGYQVETGRMMLVSQYEVGE